MPGDRRAPSPGAPLEPHAMPTVAGAPVGGLSLVLDLDLPGDGAHDRYENPVEFGRGGMGRVFIARDSVLSREIALKVLHTDAGADEATVAGTQAPTQNGYLAQRFLREARITGNLEHPSIVPVYELGRRPDGAYFYTMKLVRGRTLHRAIRDARTLEARLKLLPHVIDLCHAIAYAHSKGVIHRDIKPANVMLGSYGETVVIDWGLARVIGSDDPYAPRLGAAGSEGRTHPDADANATGAGIPVGTPHYMSPEQAAGRLDEIGPHSDVYALGVVLYELLTGRTPFTGSRPGDVLRQVLHSRPKPATFHEPSLPPALAAICARAMAPSISDRYPSAAALAEELNRFTTGALVHGHSYTAWELVRHYYRRNRALCNTVIAAIAVTGLVAIASYVRILEANQRERAQRLAAEAEAYRANIHVAASDVRAERFLNARERLEQQHPVLRDWEWGFLFEQCHRDRATAEGHRERVYQILGVPHSGRIVSNSGSEVCVWTTPSLELAHRFSIPPFPSTGISLSADERLIALSRLDGIIELYDFNTFGLVRRFQEDALTFGSAVLSGDGSRLAAGANDGTLLIWNLDGGAEAYRDPGDGTVRYVLAMNHTGSRLLQMENPGTVRLLDLDAGAPLVELVTEGHSISVNGGRFALRHGAGVEVYDLNSGELLRRVDPADGRFEQIALSGDGRRVSALGPSATAYVWPVESGIAVGAFRVENARRLLGLSQDGGYLAVAVHPNGIEIRESESGRVAAVYQGHSDRVETGVFGPDGQYFYSGSADATLKSWRMPDPISPPAGDQRGRIAGLAHDRASGRIAATTTGGSAHVLREDGFEHVLSVSSFEGSNTTRAAFHPDGDRAAVRLNPTSVLVISLPGGEIVDRLHDNPAAIDEVAYSPDGSQLALACFDGAVRLWSGDGSGRLREAARHSGRVTSVTFVPSTDLLVSASDSGEVLETRWPSGNTLRRWAHDGRSVVTMGASPAGGWVAYALDDHSIHLVDAVSGGDAKRMIGHDHRVRGLAFSERGSRLFSISDRGELKIWSVDTGQELLTLDGKQNLASDIILTHAGAVAGLDAGRLGVFPVFPVEAWARASSDPAFIAQYKEERARAARGTVIPLQPAVTVAYSTRENLRAAAVRLAAMETAVSAGDAYREPAWNPLVLLGLLPGDRLLEVGATRDPDTAAFRESLETIGEGESAEWRLDLRLSRQGRELRIEHRGVAQTVTVLERRLSGSMAAELLRQLEERVRPFERVIVEYSQRFGRESGALLPGDQDLEGLWLMPPASEDDVALLRDFGLVRGDCIGAINNIPITHYATLISGLGRAREAVEAGWTGTVELEVRRNRFHRVNLRITVE